MRRFVALGLAAVSGLFVPAGASGMEPIPAGAPALLDVPFLPQGRLLCGGASVAMVRRYWGEQDVYAEDFEALVDTELGGISTSDLVGAVRDDGWSAHPIRADPDTVRHHLSRGRPLVALLRSSGNAFHYVVVTGWIGEHLILHDPSEGPFRLRAYRDVREAWEASDLWALLLLPASVSEPPEDASSGKILEAPSTPATEACAPLVRRALEAREDLSKAGTLLFSAASLCPDDAVVFRELAAVRFREERWDEASVLAARAVALDGSDDHAWSILGAARYLSGDRDGGLAAWNRTAAPTLDRVEVTGLAPTRQEVIYRYLSLRPGTLLTVEGLRRARRRTGELPTIARARVSFEPIPGRRAKLTASVSERERFEPLPFLVVRSTVDALTDRQLRTIVASPTGGGERLEGGWRWWEERPAFWLSLDAPRMLGFPGVVTLEAHANRQSYALSPGGELVHETRRGGSIRFRDWLSSETKAELALGVDVFAARGEWLELGGTIEQRFAKDRLSLRADASRWLSIGSAAAFSEIGATLAARSTPEYQRWVLRGRLDARSIGEEAPHALWPGAGVGRARTLLLRGHPLLEDGVLSGPGIGPRLLHGTVEAERAIWRGGLARVGLATFFDWAWVSRDPGEPLRALSSAGVGLRLHALGQTLRVDGATRLGGTGFIFSAGWVESW